MSDLQESVHGIVNNWYQGQLEDGSLQLVTGEADPTLLLTGADSRAAQKAIAYGSVSIPVALRIHELALIGEDPVASRHLRELRGLEVTETAGRNGHPYSDADLVRSMDRISSLDAGNCPHAKAVAGIVAAAYKASELPQA